MGQSQSSKEVVPRGPPPRPTVPPSSRLISDLGPKGPKIHKPENKVSVPSHCSYYTVIGKFIVSSSCTYFQYPKHGKTFCCCIFRGGQMPKKKNVTKLTFSTLCMDKRLFIFTVLSFKTDHDVKNVKYFLKVNYITSITIFH